MKFTLNIFDEQKKGRIQEEKKEEAQNHGYHWSTKNMKIQTESKSVLYTYYKQREKLINQAS